MSAAAGQSRPRLLAVSHTGLFSGAERVLVQYLAAMSARWDVHCLTPAGPLVEQLDAVGIAHSVLPEMKLPGGPRPLAAVRLASRWLRAAPRIHRRARSADVVLANGVHALPGLRLARPSAKVAWLVHDVIVRRDLRLLARLGAKVLDLAIGVSQAASGFPAELGVHTTIVRNGTPWPAHAARPSPADIPVVGIVAVLTPWKGHRVFLEAAAQMERPARFELMGGAFPKDTAYVSSLRSRAAEADLAGRVTFLGPVAQPLERLAGWSVAVSSSIEPEAGSLAVLEAMSVGVPLVVSDHGGPPEFLGGAGLLVPPGDAAALAGALDELLGDEERRRRCAQEGRRLIAERHRLDQAAARFEAELARLIGLPTPAEVEP